MRKVVFVGVLIAVSALLVSCVPINVEHTNELVQSDAPVTVTTTTTPATTPATTTATAQETTTTTTTTTVEANTQPSSTSDKQTSEVTTTTQTSEQQQQQQLEQAPQEEDELADTTATTSAKAAHRILIAVESSPSHVGLRNAIRDSWGKEAEALGMDVKFFVGELGLEPKNEQQESALASEPSMVRLHDFVESRENLAHKTLDVFSYGDAKKYSAVLKVYDSTYVFPNQLQKFLDASDDVQNLYGGMFVQAEEWRKPSHVAGSRSYLDDQLPQLTEENALLPEYAWGSAVLVGRSGLKHIRKHRATLQMYRRDDVSLALWLDNVSLRKVDLSGSFYSPLVEASNPSQVTWAAPLSASEMRALSSGSNVLLSSCQKACLCATVGNEVNSGGEAQAVIASPNGVSKVNKACWQEWNDSKWTDEVALLK